MQATLTDRDALIIEHVPLARERAMDAKFRQPRSGIDAEDIASEAVVAMIRAIDRYRPSEGTLYAYLDACIRGACKNAIRAADPAGPTARATLAAAAAYEARFASAQGRMPTSAEISRAVPGYRLAMARARARNRVPLDAPVSPGGTLRAVDVLPSDAADPAEAVDADDRRRRFWERVRGVVGDAAADAMRARYVDGTPWREYAARIGEPEGTVRVHHHRAMRRLALAFSA